jgi:glycosyltransferase involved in cell wall biosynthesis
VRILQVSESLAVDFGGTAVVCTQLANHLVRAGVEVSALPLGRVNRSRPAWPLDAGVTAHECEPTGPRWLGYCSHLGATLRALPPADVVHVHGLWRVCYAQAAAYARANARPLVISLHGMLYDIALARRGRMKRLARWMFQDRMLREARVVHVTSAEEAEQLRRLGFRNSIAVLAWGVDLPEPEDGARLRPPPAEPPTVVYLGRLHPHKGIDVLLRAWSQVRRRRAGCRLVIAGSDFDGYGPSLVRLARDLEISDSVTWAGPVEGPSREELFANASVLVLPSERENFGLVVAEALARGVPIIATKGAPWSCVVNERCGWWIPSGVDPLAGALADVLTRPPAELRAMGARGRRFALATFAWDSAARGVIELYRWVLGLAPQPSFVEA